MITDLLIRKSPTFFMSLIKQYKNTVLNIKFIEKRVLIILTQIRYDNWLMMAILIKQLVKNIIALHSKCLCAERNWASFGLIAIYAYLKKI